MAEFVAPGAGTPGETRPFAVMRLSHEVVRALLTRLTAAVGGADADADAAEAAVVDVPRAAAVWADLERFVALHMRQENDVFFPLLDERGSGAVEEAGFRGEHDDDVAQRRVLAALFEAAQADPKKKDKKKDKQKKGWTGGLLWGEEGEGDGDDAGVEAAAGLSGQEALGALQAHVKAFAELHLQHLEHEEEVMMPLTREVGDFAERCHQVNRILHCDIQEFADFQFPCAVRTLAANRPPPMLAMYLKAVRAATTHHVWEVLKEIARDNIPADKLASGADYPANGVIGPAPAGAADGKKEVDESASVESDDEPEDEKKPEDKKLEKKGSKAAAAKKKPSKAAAKKKPVKASKAKASKADAKKKPTKSEAKKSGKTDKKKK